MGRWSFWPTSSDNALDQEYLFLEGFQAFHREECWLYSDHPEETKNFLENLSVDEMENIIKFKKIDDNNLYFIPFLFLRFDAYPKDEEVINFLKKCLLSTENLGEESLKYIKEFESHFSELLLEKSLRMFEEENGPVFMWTNTYKEE